MSSIVITVKSEESATHLAQKYQLDENQTTEQMRVLSELFRSMGVDQRGVVDVQVDGDSPVAASGTFTLESVVATDAITIGTVTFTFTSSPSLTTDVEVDGADDDADATALAAAINAHATVSEIVTATVEDNVVTVTAKQKGVVGNFINISSADSTITASGTHLESGAGGVTEAGKSYAMGIS